MLLCSDNVPHLINIQNRQGKTVFHVPCHFGLEGAVRLLLMKGVIGDIMDHNGNTAHDRALSRGHHTLAGHVEKWLAGTAQNLF